MKSDLPATIHLHHRNIAGGKHMLGLTRQSLSKHRQMFDQPQFILRRSVTSKGEFAHGGKTEPIVGKPQIMHLQAAC